MFIVVPKTDQPISKTYAQLVEAKAQGVNFGDVSKFWPVQFTCKAELEDFKKNFERFRKEQPNEFTEPQRYRFEIKIRNNAGVHVSDIESWLKEIIPPQEGPLEHDVKQGWINVCKCNLMFGFE